MNRMKRWLQNWLVEDYFFREDGGYLRKEIDDFSRFSVKVYLEDQIVPLLDKWISEKKSEIKNIKRKKTK